MGYKKSGSSMIEISNQQYEMSIGLRMKLLKDLASTILDEIQGLATAHEFKLIEGFNFYDEVRRFEIDLIQYALKYAEGRQHQAARLLGLKATTLNSKLKQYGLPMKRKSPAPTNERAFINGGRDSQTDATSEMSNVGVVLAAPPEQDSNSTHLADRSAKARKIN